MGLDLVSGDRNFRVGSYSGVHIVRKAVIEGFARWLEAQGRQIDAEELVEDGLRDDDRCVNYESWPMSFEQMEGTSEMVGLNAFVDHSDCDGFHSPGQAHDITAMLTAIAPYFVLDGWPADYFDRLLEFYKASAAAGERIRFG